MSQNPPPVQLILTAKDETRAAIQSAVGGLEQLKTSAAGLQGLLAGATAALAGLAAVQNFRNFVSAAAAMDDLAEKTGASVEKLSALASVAKISGVGLDVVEGSLVRLAKGLAGADEESKGAGNALAALGLKAEELKKLDTADALKAVADKLNEYKDGAGKTALAIDLLGKSGAQALPYLKDLAETQNLQAKLTAEQAAQAENLEKNLVRLSASTSGAWKEFSASVLPTVDEFVKTLLKVQNETGGVRDEIKKLAQDGTITTWAERAAIALANLGDVFQLIKKLAIEVATPIERLAKNVETVGALAGIAATGSLDEKREAIKKLRLENEAFYASLNKRLADNREPVTLFADRLKAQFALARDVAAGIAAGADLGGGGGRKGLDYTSRVDKAGSAAKDELKAIEGYVDSIREQLVGVTEGEFEKMRRKALDVFTKVDFGALSTEDQKRFREFFNEAWTSIDRLDKRAQEAVAVKQLAESFDFLARQSQAVSNAVNNFSDAMAQQARDMQFELDMVGKLSSERQRLTMLRKIDADTVRAVAAANAAADPETGASAEEIDKIYARANAAKAAVNDLNGQILTKSRDGFTGLQSAASEYFNRITNDAQNFGGAFTNIMGAVENSFVEMAKTGKFEFKGLVNSIISDLARIVVRQQITAPLAQAINGAAGAAGSGGLLDFILNRGGVSGSGFTGDLSLDAAIGLRAAGGPVTAGSPYIVGEKGPELFVPNLSGSIVPNHAMGGVNVYQTIHIDSRSDQASIMQAMAVAKNEAVAEIEDRRRRTGGAG